MSRTRKDAPVWVRAMRDPDAEELHRGCSDDVPPGQRECDINGPSGRCRRYGGLPPGRQWWHWKPTRAWRNTLYYAPERARVRNSLRIALREWNTWRDTDVEPPWRQTKNSLWGGGWWD